MLVDHADAGLDGVGRRMENVRHAVNEDLTLVRLVHAVQLAHERALARAVFAEQGMHFTRIHVEVHTGVGQHTGEALDDAAHFDVVDPVLERGRWRS